MPTNTPALLLMLLLCSPLSLAATQASERSSDDAPDIQGTWELVRVDGLRPADVPPGGYYPKLIVKLGEDGESKYWFTGEEDQPSNGTFSIEDGKLCGWLSLSNDLDTPRPLELPAEGWMELTYPEGFVATFRRVSPDEEIEPGCAFFTVVGYDYDAEQVARLKEAMFHFQPEPVPAELIGRWTAQQGNPQMRSVEFDLTIRDDRAHLIVRSLDSDLGSADGIIVDTEGPLEVSGEFLRSSALACGSVHHFSLDDGILEMSNSAEPAFRLGPVE